MFAGVSPFVAAHHLLREHARQNAPGWGLMAPLKLIKMTYIAHGFHLALTETPLVDTDVEAWPYGPVLPEVYHGAKDFRWREVPVDLFQRYADGLDGGEDKLSADLLSIVQGVVRVYGKYDGKQLSTATHKPDTPWSEVNKKNPGGIIPNDLIKAYYKKHVDQ